MDFLGKKIEESGEIMQEALRRFNPKYVIVGFSGGGDSLTTCRTLDRLSIPFKCLLINTGIFIREQRDFVIKTCRENNWELIEQGPVYKTYKQTVIANGFPGPALHGLMYINLKEKSFKRVFDNYGKDCILVTGVRKAESERRSKTIKDAIQVYQGMNWVAPIIHFDEDDKEEMLDGVETNPVGKNLNISGDCCCGAYAYKGELEQIDYFYPETGKVLHDLQDTLFSIGFTWGWDDPVPTGKKYAEIMDIIFPGYAEIQKQKEIIKAAKKKKNKDQDNLFQPACHKCHLKDMSIIS